MMCKVKLILLVKSIKLSNLPNNYIDITKYMLLEKNRRKYIKIIIVNITIFKEYFYLVFFLILKILL